MRFSWLDNCLLIFQVFQVPLGLVAAAATIRSSGPATCSLNISLYLKHMLPTCFFPLLLQNVVKSIVQTSFVPIFPFVLLHTSANLSRFLSWSHTDVPLTHRVLVVVHGLSQNRAEGDGGESARLFPHGSDLQQGSEGWPQTQLLRQIFLKWHQCSVYNKKNCSYAACRWDSCWPGSAGCRHMSCTDTDVCKAGWACPASQTDRPHTRCCCHCSHRLTAGGGKKRKQTGMESPKSNITDD